MVVVVPDPEEGSCSWNELQPLSQVAARRENARQRLVDDRGKVDLPSTASDASVAVYVGVKPTTFASDLMAEAG